MTSELHSIPCVNTFDMINVLQMSVTCLFLFSISFARSKGFSSSSLIACIGISLPSLLKEFETIFSSKGTKNSFGTLNLPIVTSLRNFVIQRGIVSAFFAIWFRMKSNLIANLYHASSGVDLLNISSNFFYLTFTRDSFKSSTNQSFRAISAAILERSNGAYGST